METMDFSQPIRQSAKGILIIFVFNAIKFFKSFFPAFIALGLAFFRKKSFLNLTPLSIIAIIVGVLIIILIIAILKYLNFKFYVTDTEFRLATGILNKDTTVIPKSKIQNVNIQQNFLHQIIDVVSLNIETAGDKTSEIEITALDKSTALRLKKELFIKKNIQTDITESIDKTNVFFKITLKQLLLEGILQNHLKSFVLIISFTIGLYYQFKDYIQSFEINVDERFIEFDNVSLLNLMYFNIIAISIVMIISVIYSVIRIFIVNYNLEVVENEKTIEINKGLFNKISLSLTPEKIQNIIIRTNAIKRYFNLYSLNVKQAMSNEKQSKNFKIIALGEQQVSQLLNRLATGYTSVGEINKPEFYYKRVLAFYSLLFTLLLNVVLFFVFNSTVFWLNLIWIPLCILNIHIRYKRAYFTITEKFVTVGSGAIDSVTNILEINKIQSVQIKQSVFQKRRDIASVIIHTASKQITILYIKENNAKSIHDFLVFSVESQDENWM